MPIAFGKVDHLEAEKRFHEALGYLDTLLLDGDN